MARILTARATADKQPVAPVRRRKGIQKPVFDFPGLPQETPDAVAGIAAWPRPPGVLIVAEMGKLIDALQNLQFPQLNRILPC